MDIIKLYYSKWSRKPQDPSLAHDPITTDGLASHVVNDSGYGLIACSSAIDNDLYPLDIFTKTFDPKKQVIIGLDSLCSRHLFSHFCYFIYVLQPIAPFEIYDVGENIKAVSKGNVCIRYHDSTGIIQDKILLNAFHAPKSSIHLIFIPQLAHDTD